MLRLSQRSYRPLYTHLPRPLAPFPLPRQTFPYHPTTSQLTHSVTPEKETQSPHAQSQTNTSTTNTSSSNNHKNTPSPPKRSRKFPSALITTALTSFAYLLSQTEFPSNGFVENSPPNDEEEEEEEEVEAKPEPATVNAEIDAEETLLCLLIFGPLIVSMIPVVLVLVIPVLVFIPFALPIFLLAWILDP